MKMRPVSRCSQAWKDGRANRRRMRCSRLASSTNQPKNRGRKPRLYTIAKKVYRISYEEWCDVAMYLMQCTKKEVESIANDENTPIWVVNLCRSLHKDTGKGITTTLQDIMTRMWGRPGQNIDVTTRGESINMEPLSIEIIDSRDKVQDEDSDN